MQVALNEINFGVTEKALMSGQVFPFGFLDHCFETACCFWGLTRKRNVLTLAGVDWKLRKQIKLSVL